MKINLQTLITIIVVNMNFCYTFCLAQVNEIQLYTFAHSLIDHRPPLIETPSDETTILHWIYDIANTRGKTFASTGQFGQLNNHVDGLPPNSNLGYDLVPNSWDENESTFADSELNTILLTVANFIQYTPPDQPDPSDPSARSVQDMTETLFEWTADQLPNLQYYIYGNWPEMDLQNSYPPNLPSQNEIDEFHDITIGREGFFAEWWLDYQDLLKASKPELNTKLIPVGMIISKLLRNEIPNQIPFNELYEDSAPHGRANIYFLAGLITYMAMYEEKIPINYTPSTIISPIIRSNLSSINDFIWQELNNFNYPNGESRVFYSEPVVSMIRNGQVGWIKTYPNPVKDYFSIQNNTHSILNFDIIGIEGHKHRSSIEFNTAINVNMKSLENGIYFLVIKNKNNEVLMNRKIFKH